MATHPYPVSLDPGLAPAVSDDAMTSSALLPSSGVCWAAILAGAAAAAALSLILIVLGVGLGFSAVSPWSGEGIGAATFGVSTIAWLTLTQLLASGMGGYLAGRLRIRWTRMDTDEVYFRDTAHGFLAWAVASLLTAAVLGSAIASAVSGGVKAGAAVAGGAANATGMAALAGASSSGDDSAGHGQNGSRYFVDLLFRPGTNAAAPAGPAAASTEGSVNATPPAAPTAEIGRIFATAIADGNLAPDDLRYAGQVVSQRTGLSEAQAQQRVSDSFARLQAQLKQAETTTRDAADAARKAGAAASLWLFVSLLIGAFIASLAATWGGRRRDMF